MSSVSTIKASLGDFTSLLSWEDTYDVDLTGTGVCEAVCYPFVDSAGSLMFYGGTTTASDYYYVHAHSSARHIGVWDASTKYVLSVTNNLAIQNYMVNHFRIDGIQVETAAINSSNHNIIEIADCSAGADYRLSNLLLKGAFDIDTPQYGVRVNDSDAVVYMWNCAIWNLYNNLAGVYGVVVNNGSLYAYSCVGVGAELGIYKGGGTLIAKNCYWGATKADGFCYYGSPALTTCASSDATGSVGLRGIAKNTDTFVNVTAGSEDFHLAADGLSPLQGAGTDTSGDAAPMNFTTDIDGDTRSGSWDIGADEYAAGGGSNVTLPITGVSGTASLGAIVLTLALALAGVSTNLTYPLTGVMGAGAVGSVTAGTGVGNDITIPLTGVSANPAYPISGVVGTGAVGNVTVATPTDIALGITGVNGAGTVGIVNIFTGGGEAATCAIGSVSPSVSPPFTGNEATAGIGNISPGKSCALTGMAASGAVGGWSMVTWPISGVGCAGDIGTLTPRSTFPISGNGATVGVGAAAPAGAAPLSGVEAIAVTPGDSVVFLSGVTATGTAFSMFAAPSAPVYVHIPPRKRTTKIPPRKRVTEILRRIT